MSRTILVIGPQRTGSSAAAGILHHLGVPMGVTPITANYEYFESDELTGLLRRVAGNWRCPLVYLITEQSKDALRKYIARQDLEHPIWGAKTPYLGLVGHHIIPLIDDLRVILTLRDFEATVKSLVVREPSLPPGLCRFIQGQNFAATELAYDALRVNRTSVAKIGFNALINNTRKVVESLTSFVFEGTGISPTPEAIEEAIAFVDPELRHHTTQYQDEMEDQKRLAASRVENVPMLSVD